MTKSQISWIIGREKKRNMSTYQFLSKFIYSFMLQRNPHAQTENAHYSKTFCAHVTSKPILQLNLNIDYMTPNVTFSTCIQVSKICVNYSF